MLKGKVIAVTAAGAGIGFSVCSTLAAAGASVVAADLDLGALQDLGESVTPVECDLLQPDAAARVVNEALSRHGRLDGFVACLGGVISAGSSLAELGDADWQRTFELNLLPAVWAARAAIAPLSERGGSLVFVGSDLARQPDPVLGAYAAMKAALLSFSKSLSIELGPHIRANVVSPGPTRTPGRLAGIEAMSGANDKRGVEVAIREYVEENRRMPLGRLIEPEEVAHAILFLLSDPMAAMTGAELVIDGGVRKAA
jgi:NAD(P)-dependent dehydrogenase (short-subunit alcohol dehydrogenase family)